MYVEGRGVKQDYFESFEWNQKAAYQGDGGAQYNIAVKYFTGEGVLQSRQKAFEWFEKSCSNKDQSGCKYYAKMNRGEL
jgi:TPR repeat protein